jgi:rubrerythrin
MDQQIINGSMKALLYAQQGELDAVAMYNRLSELVSESDAAVFKQLAAEEGRHASVFHNYTNTVLKPKRAKSILIPFLYKTIGREKTYKLIADGEYSAAEKYKTLACTFADVKTVMGDEARHGDMVKGLIR